MFDYIKKFLILLVSSFVNAISIFSQANFIPSKAEFLSQFNKEIPMLVNSDNYKEKRSFLNRIAQYILHDLKQNAGRLIKPYYWQAFFETYFYAISRKATSKEKEALSELNRHISSKLKQDFENLRVIDCESFLNCCDITEQTRKELLSLITCDEGTYEKKVRDFNFSFAHNCSDQFKATVKDQLATAHDRVNREITVALMGITLSKSFPLADICKKNSMEKRSWNDKDLNFNDEDRKQNYIICEYSSSNDSSAQVNGVITINLTNKTYFITIDSEKNQFVQFTSNCSAVFHEIGHFLCSFTKIFSNSLEVFGDLFSERVTNSVYNSAQSAEALWQEECELVQILGIGSLYITGPNNSRLSVPYLNFFSDARNNALSKNPIRFSHCGGFVSGMLKYNSTFGTNHLVPKWTDSYYKLLQAFGFSKEESYDILHPQKNEL